MMTLKQVSTTCLSELRGLYLMQSPLGIEINAQDVISNYGNRRMGSANQIFAHGNDEVNTGASRFRRKRFHRLINGQHGKLTDHFERSHSEQVCQKCREPGSERALSNESQFELRQADGIVTPLPVPARYVQ